MPPFQGLMKKNLCKVLNCSRCQQDIGYPLCKDSPNSTNLCRLYRNKHHTGILHLSYKLISKLIQCSYYLHNYLTNNHCFHNKATRSEFSLFLSLTHSLLLIGLILNILSFHMNLMLIRQN
jgi:hypothetical protein